MRPPKTSINLHILYSIPYVFLLGLQRHVQTWRIQSSLRIRALLSSKSSLSTRRIFASLATHRTPSEDSDQTALMHSLIVVFAGRTYPLFLDAWVPVHVSFPIGHSSCIEYCRKSRYTFNPYLSSALFSPFPILGVSGVRFSFYFISNRKSYKQTV